MPDITPTLSRNHGEQNNVVMVFTWPSLVAGSLNGTPVAYPEWADCCVQVIANTAGGATCVIQGSNDGTNWGTLFNAQSTALSFTATGAPKQIVERPLFIRPSVSGGGGTEDWTAILVIRRHTPLKA